MGESRGEAAEERAVRTDGGSETATESSPVVDGSAETVEYGMDDKPPIERSILLGFQHYLTMIGSNIAVPLVLAAAMGMPADATARLVGTFFVVSGVATLAQTTIGNRYPLVQGASFAILAPALAIIGVLQASGAGWETMIVELQGAMIVAGIAQVAIGYLGLFGRLKRFLSPVVIAPVIALVGLALFDVPQITNPETQSIWLFLLTLVLIIGCSQYLDRYSNVLRLYPVLIGLAGAWLLAAGLSVGGVIESGSSAYVDLTGVSEASIIQPIVPFQWGTPQFTSSFVIGIFAGVLASMVESFGDYYAVARISDEKAPSGKRINHGLAMEGFGNIFAGIMGTGNGSTSYSENIGAIGITGVASRFVVQVGAVVMLIAGFVGFVGAIVTTIPDPIVGGLFVVMFAQIIGIGLSQLQYVDLNQNRNVFIIGITLLSGLSIPSLVGNFAGGEGAAAIESALAGVAVLGPALEAVGEIAYLGAVFGLEPIAQILFVIGTTGIAVGGIVGFVLDLTIPGSRKSRGLTEWEDITEGDNEFLAFHERFGSSEPEPEPSDD
ncbi:uracil-xanthine permease family protein [Halovenus sp. HT40]|uniref:uracil-xanthine permease family protein n=1 Tax=Halovenus sp. HT40 TaxID=3126691 RepID=UPI003FA552A7